MQGMLPKLPLFRIDASWETMSHDGLTGQNSHLSYKADEQYKFGLNANYLSSHIKKQIDKAVTISNSHDPMADVIFYKA